MAEEIRKDQDSTLAEADLHKHYSRCRKNPDHKVFTPANKFNIEHLPDGYRNINLFNFIGAMINLTVRISCRFTSEGRPKTFPATCQPYPFYNQRCKKCLKFGTGFVVSVLRFTHDNKTLCKGGQTCPCQICENSPSPMTQWYKVAVSTARHVVFDNVEAVHTTCQLFYNSEEEKNKIQEFKGETVSTYDKTINDDMCEMICYIHDLDLGEKLEAMKKDYEKHFLRLFQMLMDYEIEHPLTVIVSHPHGASKQVTIGQMAFIEEVLGFGRRTRYVFTTQTCPGSSGSPVFILGKSQFNSLHVHSQRCKQNGFNMSVTT